MAAILNIKDDHTSSVKDSKFFSPAIVNSKSLFHFKSRSHHLHLSVVQSSPLLLTILIQESIIILINVSLIFLYSSLLANQPGRNALLHGTKRPAITRDYGRMC
jgi:hypothetical protein